ncbi:MAG: calcium/sodium antiporter [Hyphomicrobiales bacterium]|nr:calcium/sodium antiporter [Hyphomicrobiales bacterium]
MLYVEIVGGLILLVVGGDSLVRGAVSLAERLGVSRLLIGLTLVGFGTSTPELVTSLQAAAIGTPGIAVGNVIGSNIANILLILGVAAVINPLTTSKGAFIRDGTVLVLASALCVGIVLHGYLGRFWGLAFVTLLASYIVFTYLRERRIKDASAAMHEAEAEAVPEGPSQVWLALVLAVGGIVITILGARLLVDGAVELAGAAGISETVIGLTIVAIGTSLPELVTSVMAAIRRQPDIAFGNVVGSNIYNILGILGVTALVQPIPIPSEIANVDIWVMVGATVLFLAFSFTGWRLNRAEGSVFLAGYAAYLAWLISVADVVH